MAKVETLVDDFTTQQPWWGPWGNTAWVDGRLRIEASDYPGASTWPVPRFDFTESAAFIECEPAPPAATRQSLFSLRESGTNHVIIGVDNDTLLCRVVTNGAFNDTTPPYDPVAMRYLRLRHSGSTIYWETAPAAFGPWTIRRQVPQPPWSITAVEVHLSAGNWGGLPGGVFAWFDNLNYVVPTGPRAFTASKEWAAAYAQGQPVASLWKAGQEFYARR